ncbi:MAG: bifunctional aldolase/short-chain dehydrogenase, partial [Pseudorhizobium sp.]
MIANRWQDSEATAFQDAAGQDPAARELALRVYTSRLIGMDPDLVMHGGGNTSVKLKARDIFGEELDVIHIKGSGWDLETIKAAGLPAVRMAPLMRLRELEALSDEDMVNIQRSNLMDSTAPNPSVETLLHAYIPHAYVDHTHATAFLTLANLPEVAEATREIFGSKLALVPYVMPGFALAKLAAETYEAHPGIEGLLLVNHGHFAWGPTAKASYDKIIEHTNQVEEWLASRRPGKLVAVARPQTASVAETLSALRGAIARHLPESAAMPVFDLRDGDAVLDFLERKDLASLATRGVATPDHVIRTKGHPLHLTRADVARGPEAISAVVDRFVADYIAYFERNAPRIGGAKTMLSPVPNLAWIEGIGLVGMGATATAARIAADIGEQTLRIMADGEARGGFYPIREADLFDMEYWSLEQAKLAGAKPKPFTGQVAVVTGGAGAIGAAIVKAFAAEGAHVVALDLDGDKAAATARSAGNSSIGIACDITDPVSVRAAFDKTVATFGGADIVVSNAGAAWESAIATMDDALLRRSFELNFFAHQTVAQNAVRIMKAQQTGGALLFNASKQAVNPGAKFGAYGLPKAATLFLSRQYALEHGADNIRVNAVNADRIRSGLLNDEMIANRAAARGLSVKEYMGGNL